MITLRFMEYEYYDPMKDQETLRLQAVTNVGTWFSDVPAHSKVAASKKAFQEYVLSAMSMGHRPHEVKIG